MPTAASDNAGYYVPYTIDGAGEKTVTFKTENKFVDRDARVVITTPAAVSPALTITPSSNTVTVGTLSSGSYPITAAVNGTVAPTTAGWLSLADVIVSDTEQIGTIPQSTMTLGSTAIADEGQITPTDSNQTLTISAGYSTQRTLTIKSTSTSAAGEITSGSATITSLSYAYDSATSKFNVTGSATVSAPTVVTPGYISSTAGTKNTNTANVATTVNRIALKVGLSGNGLIQPSLTKRAISITGVVDAASGSATTTTPSSGVYIAVRSEQQVSTITGSASVVSDGYGTTTNYGINQGSTADSLSVGALQSSVHYIPITTTSASLSGRTVSYGSGWITAGSTSVPVATVTSGAGTATISDPSYNSTSEKFVLTASGTIGAPTVSIDGYISTSEGTRNTNSISGSKELDVIEIGYTTSGTPKVTPVIARTAKPSGDTWTDAASGAATTTKPSSGAYVQVDAAASSNTLTITPTVVSDGYGTTTTHTSDSDTVSVGSNAATTAYIPITAGTVTGGTINSVSMVSTAYDSSINKFKVTGAFSFNAPTATSEGYVSSTIGTLSAPSAQTLSITEYNKISLTASIFGKGTKTPSILKNSATNISEASSATTTQPSSGYYIAVHSNANTGTVTPVPSVSSAGYGDTTYYTVNTGSIGNFTVGANQSAVTYIPIAQATFNNTATSGVTYTDISSTGPILISGSYLFIDGGYTPPTKISLARLVPDASGTNAGADYILEGYTAFNNDGTLIIGTIQTYDGTYTIT